MRAAAGSGIGGIIRHWEIDAGVIRHGLDLSIADFQLQRGPVWPATAEDAGVRDPEAEPSLDDTAALTNMRRDLATIRPHLRVVTNNGPSSVNGGGTPRRPLAPPL